ncbi:MAG: TSUP family transporter [Candidatus Zipacnadales bacterium]
MKLFSTIGLFAAIGLAAGTFGGLFGIGGGVLMVPVLVWAYGWEQQMAQGTSLTVMVPMALAGCAQYALRKNVDWTAAMGLAIGAVIGVTFLGTPFAHYLKGSVLQKLFGILMIVLGLRTAGVFTLIGTLLGFGQSPP